MTLTELSLLRHYVDEQTEDPYGNSFLLDLIESAGSIEAAAAVVWQMKAGRYAALVDTSEAGASRKMSQLAAQARAMASHYSGGSDTIVGGDDRFTVTRPIERA